MLVHVVELLLGALVATSVSTQLFGTRSPATETYQQTLSVYVAASGTGYIMAFAVDSEDQV